MIQPNFKDDLAFSDLPIKQVEAVLCRRFPDMVGVEKASLEMDKKGVDYWVVLPSGKRIGIDMKIRRQDFGDISLETQSSDGKVGWALNSNSMTDYVVWYWLDTQRIFIMDFQMILRITLRYWLQWAQVHPFKQQDNGTYKSKCLFVPMSVIQSEMTRWTESRIPV